MNNAVNYLNHYSQYPLKSFVNLMQQSSLNLHGCGEGVYHMQCGPQIASAATNMNKISEHRSAFYWCDLAN